VCNLEVKKLLKRVYERPKIVRENVSMIKCSFLMYIGRKVCLNIELS